MNTLNQPINYCRNQKSRQETKIQKSIKKMVKRKR